MINRYSFIILALVIMIGCNTTKDRDGNEINYGDTVVVVEGFYKGQTGKAIRGSSYDSYYVEIEIEPNLRIHLYPGNCEKQT